MKKNNSLLIWDSKDAVPLDRLEDKVYWQSFSIPNPKNDISILQLVENNADQLKSQFLALIYKLGEAKIKGKRIVDYLEIRRGFSYWWMRLFVEKSNFDKSPQIHDVIKLLALQGWIKDRDYTDFIVVSSNGGLIKPLQLLAKKNNIKNKQLKIQEYLGVVVQ